MQRYLVIVIIFSLLLAGCDGEDERLREAEESEAVAFNLLTLRSPAFAEGERIPTQYTCDGVDIPPPLTWQDLPADAASYALIVDDPDAPGGIWTHWVVYNVPPEITEFPEDVSPDLGTQGTNSWNEIGYRGPCPPDGEHRYFFKLFALDIVLNLEEGADRETVLEAVDGHILAQGQLMGVYERE